MLLTPMYHWSPSSSFKGIKRRGLVPRTPDGHDGCDCTENCHPGEQRYATCLSPSPLEAWTLAKIARSALFAPPWESWPWHVWQVMLVPEDHTYVRTIYGNLVSEIRVLNHIPKRRVQLVGERWVP